MKKLLLLIFLAPLLWGCSSDDDPKEETACWEVYISNLDEVEDCIDSSIDEKDKNESPEYRKRMKELVKEPIIQCDLGEKHLEVFIDAIAKSRIMTTGSDCGVVYKYKKVEK